MVKKREYRFNSYPTGIAFTPLGCSPAAVLINPDVTAASPPVGTGFTLGTAKTLTNIHVQLIYWGAWWSGNPLAARVTNAVTNLLAGPYMTYLAQYGVHRGNVRGTSFAADSEPGAFTYQSVRNFIRNLLDNDRLPEPDEDWPIVYAVILPANSAFQGDSRIETVPLPAGVVSQVGGANSSFTWNDYDPGDVDNDPAYYCWAGNDGTVDYITTVLSHELAELSTDPNGGNGVRQIGGTAASGQIGDVLTVCQGWCDYVRGVKAQGYWSQLDATGALPKMYSIRRTLFGKSIGGKIPRPMTSANAWITKQF